MKTIKVSEATREQLDYLVAMCDGAKGFRMHTYPGIDAGPPVPVIDWRYGWTLLVDTSYSTDPALMQPIMEREFISTSPGDWDVDSVPVVKNWCAWSLLAEIHNDQPFIYGPTQLVAAARCFVVSNLGETAEVPEELT